MTNKYDKYAVVLLKGKQYLVREGGEFLIDKTDEPKITPEVLLVKGEKELKVGKPTVSDAKVSIKVLNQEEKGKKIEVYKFKSKSRYRRHIGFRPKYTRLLVEKISL